MRCLLLLLSAATLGYGQRAGEADLSRRTLQAQLVRATADERVHAYEEALQAHPDDVQLQSGLIGAYLQKLRESGERTYLDRASQVVDRMLEHDGGNFAALRFQNEIDLQRHDFKGVADRSRDMLKYAPSDPGAWGNLGDALMELGEYEQAGQAYLRMFALRPNLGSYNRLGYWHFVTGDAPGAMALMRSAIEAGDAQPEVVAWCWAELGDMDFKTGRLDEASGAYRAALHLFPRLHRAYAGLGRVEAARGRTEAAIADYERAESIVPMVEYAGALEDLYGLAGKSEKVKEQRDLIAVVEKLGAANRETTNRNLALVLADHDRELDAALQMVEAEIPMRSDVYTWDALSWVLFKNGRLEEAKTASAKALKLQTPEPVFYYHASKIALANGDEKSARQYDARVLGAK